MNFLQAIILGIVEGVTEFLPVSSTGHLILTTDLLGIQSSDFTKSFTVLIQSGAILAVILLYWRKLLTHKSLVFKVFTAFVPTAFIGFALYGFIKQFLLDNTTVVLWALLIGGVLLIALEMYFKKAKIDEGGKDDVLLVSYKQSFLIGIFQAISVIPGTSRALASIFGGILVGLQRRQAVEFSFLLAIPTILAATALDLLETNFYFSNNEWLMLILGFITSFAVAYVVIKWFISYISTHTFSFFGYYRIILAILAYLWLMK